MKLIVKLNVLLIISVSILLFNAPCRCLATVLTATGCPINWNASSNPFGTTPSTGDTLIIPTGCQLTLTASSFSIAASNITLIINGTLSCNTGCSLNLATGTTINVPQGGVITATNPLTSNAAINIAGVTLPVWKATQNGTVEGGVGTGFTLGGPTKCYFSSAVVITSETGGSCVSAVSNGCAQNGAISIYSKCLTAAGVAGAGCTSPCNYSVFSDFGYQMCNGANVTGNCNNGPQRMGIVFNVPTGCTATVLAEFKVRTGAPTNACSNSGLDGGDTMRLCNGAGCTIYTGSGNANVSQSIAQAGPGSILVAGTSNRSEEIITYSFSKTGACTGGCSVLPVSFLSISGDVANNTASIAWSTASETNNHYFTIEKSTDAINYVEVGRIDGAGTTSSLHNYNFSFEQAYNSTLYVRIKQTDYDGKFSYSNTIVTNTNTPTTNVALTLSPNPTNYGLTLQSNLGVIERICIMDITGVERIAFNNNNSTSFVDVSTLPAGIYFINTTINNAQHIAKFVKE